MAYVRGHREDYNSWESLGCTGWGWSNVENYFKKMEDYFLPGGSNSCHSILMLSVHIHS